MNLRFEQRFTKWYERLTPFRAVRTIISVAMALVVIAGVLVRLVEPDKFTNIWLSLWWASETVTTVGYGDIVPTSVAGRIVAVGLMLTGVSLIPMLSGVTISLLLSKNSREREAEVERQRLEIAAALGKLDERLDRLERPGA